MPSQRCRAPGCGRFVTSSAEWCRRHAVEHGTSTAVLDFEIRALRYVLTELLNRNLEIEQLATLIPRVSSIAIRAEHARHLIGSQKHDEMMEFLGRVADELNRRDSPSPHVPEAPTLHTDSAKGAPS